MITFHNIYYRNFLSVGNSGIEITLDKFNTNLVVGQNGAGKSTMCEAISFALFGKPYRNIRKPQLINSVNQKDCYVSIEFTIGNNKYTVNRGLKPVKFEILENGSLINQSSDNRDYQKFLEQNILKLNHKTFHQIVVLGSSSYVPFMQLPTGQRRMIIEELLDINIFSRMNIILKEQMAITKNKLSELNDGIEQVNYRININKRHIKDIEKINNKQKEEKQIEINKINEKINEIKTEVKYAKDYIEKHTEHVAKKHKELHADMKNNVANYAVLKGDKKNINTTIKFFKNNDECPTCSQVISKVLKNNKLNNAEHEFNRIVNEMSELEVLTTKIEASLQKIIEEDSLIKEKNNFINNALDRIEEYENRKNKLNTINNNEKDLSQKIENEKNQLTDFKDLKIKLQDKKIRENEKQIYQNHCLELLKDTGIKTQVIKEYLPTMNKLINKYLNMLDLFISFHLDENFDEEIRSRHRDVFKYSSFSEGEKMRIDLAILFAWRQISRMKNSVACNLLIMDETMDASMDTDGVDNLLKIIYESEKGLNVFVISHKGDILDGKFKRKIELKKDGNFTKIISDNEVS